MACPATTIRIRTRCVEEAWHGGCERSERTCSRSQIDDIFDALDGICDKLDSCDLSGLSDLKDCLRRASENVVWRCASLGDSIIGQTSGNEITLTPSAFASTTNRFEAIVFHELVHACGGTELDSEAFENHCYRGAGATVPTSGDFPKFRDDGGRWVNWNGSTGSVTTKDGQALNVNNAAFVDPNPPSGNGGGWI
ncbi:MAG: hypothetical protein PVH37_20890 [Desulfobacterales bacterium]